ncbi:MAG: iron-containing redox enzyme family protein, partial [Pseudomonadota bacterium]
ALNDLKALGKDVSSLPLLSPAPTTIAVTSFAYYQAGHLNPVGYLGYLYFLEFLPTTAGGVFTNALRRVGVPDTAMSFLEEHTTVDVHHNRLMEGYVDALVRTEDDVQSVAYAMRVTGDLYARMLGQAFLAPAPEDHWGAACEEAA